MSIIRDAAVLHDQVNHIAQYCIPSSCMYYNQELSSLHVILTFLNPHHGNEPAEGIFRYMHTPTNTELTSSYVLHKHTVIYYAEHKRSLIFHVAANV